MTLKSYLPSKLSVGYKCNVVELHRDKKISSNFDIQINRIINKCAATELPNRFVDSTIDNLNDGY